MLLALHAPRFFTPASLPTTRGRTTLCVLTAVLSLAAPLHAAAQNLFRGVDSSGRAVFSDRMEVIQPPPAQAVVLPPIAPASESPDEAIALPYVLRQAHSKYPVIFYTTGDCSPCDAARTMLLQRGVPYQERSVISESDQRALKAFSGQDLLPFTTIGKQHLTGWDEAEWTRYLDLAGYPAQSVLPSHWKPKPATAITPQPTVTDTAKEVVDGTAPLPSTTLSPATRATSATSAPNSAKRGTPAAVSTNPAGLSF